MTGIAASRRKAIMEKMKKARATGIGNNFRDGRYRLVGKRAGIEDGHKGMRFQASWVVMQAFKVPVVGLGGGGPSGLEKGKAFDIEPNPIGSTVDWLAMDLDKEDQPGAGNVRKLFMELFNVKDLDDDTYFETLAEVCDYDPDTGEPLARPLNLFKGLVIDMETKRHITQKKEQEIVISIWQHVPPTSYDKDLMAKWVDDVAARAAAYEKQLAASVQAQLPAGAPLNPAPEAIGQVSPGGVLLPPGAVQQPV